MRPRKMSLRYHIEMAVYKAGLITGGLFWLTKFGLIPTETVWR